MGIDDLKRELENMARSLKAKAIEATTQVVEEGVEYARVNHTYQDRTGNLTRSIKGRIEGNKGILEATAPYAEFVERKGYDVISGAGLYMKNRIKTVLDEKLK